MKKISGKQRLKMYAYGDVVGDPIPKKKPYNLDDELTAKALSSNLYIDNRSAKDVILSASKKGNIDPSLLLSSAWQEGFNKTVTGYGVSDAYENAVKGYSEFVDDKSKKVLKARASQNKLDKTQFPIDGFSDYGLDTFGNNYDKLKKYLPEGFDKRFQLYDAYNDKKDKAGNYTPEKIRTAAFRTNEDALIAKAAFLNYEKDNVLNYAKKNKIDLDDDASTYFTLASYNSGFGNAQTMLNEYAKAKDKTAYINKGLTSLKGVHKNIAPRYNRRELSNNLLTGTFATGGEAGATGSASAGGAGWMSLAQQIPGIADALINVFENDPRAYSRQPTLNADTMRQMVTPYNHFAMGGETGFDEQTLAQLQAMADEQGISVEELLQQLQDAQMNEEVEEEEPNDLYGEDNIDQFAYGGKSKKKMRMYANGGQAVPIEVEDNEVIQTPDGKLAQMKGATHEEGGIDVNVPAGTKIYSDRLKIDGKTMQERKIKREKAIKRIERALIKNPGDKLLQGSYERTLETTGAEEAQDMKLQKFLNSMFNSTGEAEAPESSTDMGFAYGGKVKYQFGGDPGDGSYYDKTGYHNPLLTKNLQQLAQQMQEEELMKKVAAGVKNNQVASKDNIPAGTVYTSNKNSPNFQPEVGGGDEAAGTATGNKNQLYSGKLTLGDWIGIGGNAFNAIAPILNTVNNAAGNKPNVNRYLGFGREAIETNEQAQNIAGRLKSSELTDIDTATNTARLRNRNSTQSVNTLRALDAITDMNTSKAKQSAGDSFSKTMMNLLGQKGQLENIKDRMEMAGEERRDIEDKADRDNYYSNMAENLVNLGTNVQGIGRNLNVSQENQDIQDLIGLTSQNGITVARNKKTGRLEIVNS